MNTLIALPSKPGTQGAARVEGQAGRRFTDTFYDMHKSQRFPNGRPFTGEREYAATPEKGHQPGFISPDLQQCAYITNDQGVIDRVATLASAWSAPWIPYAKYFKFNYQRKLITFDYARGVADEKESLNKYYKAAAKLAGANGWGEVKYGVIPSYQITAIIGDPSPYLPIYQAALAGDPWLLGHIDEPNEKLAEILGQNLLFDSFEAQASGLSMRAMPQAEQKPQGVVTVDKVLATPTDDLMKMIAEMVAKTTRNVVQEELAARDSAKKTANKDRMAKARAARGKNKQEAEANAA